MGPSISISSSRVLGGILAGLIILNTAIALWFSMGIYTGQAVQSIPHTAPQTLDLHRPANNLELDSAEKIAMIIDTRIPDNLVPLILHFAMVLGPSWTVVLFTMEAAWEMPASPPFRRAVQAGQVRIQFLPADTNLKKWKTVSWFFTRPWLWEQVQSASRVLLFQTDSIICSNSNKTVDDFLEWDFIGAPISPFLGGHGYNGGLSLRNPKMILDILASPSNDFDELWRTNQTGLYVEDQFFYNKMLALPNAKLPDREVAKQFSVESYWYDRPLGFHAPHTWNEDRMDQIWKYCPEVQLSSKEKKILFVDLTEQEE